MTPMFQQSLTVTFTTGGQHREDVANQDIILGHDFPWSWLLIVMIINCHDFTLIRRLCLDEAKSASMHDNSTELIWLQKKVLKKNVQVLKCVLGS